MDKGGPVTTKMLDAEGLGRFGTVTTVTVPSIWRQIASKSASMLPRSAVEEDDSVSASPAVSEAEVRLRRMTGHGVVDLDRRLRRCTARRHDDPRYHLDDVKKNWTVKGLRSDPVIQPMAISIVWKKRYGLFTENT